MKQFTPFIPFLGIFFVMYFLFFTNDNGFHVKFINNPFLFYSSSIIQGILFLILLIIFFNRNLGF